MGKNSIKLEDIAKTDPFKTPDGYFESLPAGIMSRLPERVAEAPQKPGLWQRVQPWIYMAAMFTGISLMIKMFVPDKDALIKNYAESGLNLTSSAEIEDFYRYYEEELAGIIYEDSFYLSDLSEETD